MILTTEQLKSVDELPAHQRLVFADFLDTISDLESRLKAANEAALRPLIEKWHKKAGKFWDSEVEGVYYECARELEFIIPEPSALPRHDEKLKADFAAVMGKIAYKICWRCNSSEWKPIAEDGTHESIYAKNTVHEWCDSRLIWHAIPTDYASALARHDEKLKAEFAAVMEDVIKILEFSPTFHKHVTLATLCHCEVCAYVRGNVSEIRARFTRKNYASALDRRLAEARLEPAEFVYRYAHWFANKKPASELDAYMGELRRAVKGRPMPVEDKFQIICPTCYGSRMVRKDNSSMNVNLECPDCKGTGISSMDKRLRAQGKGDAGK